ncbi:ImmA/IrrE family metallo-endopeptidase [Xanthomonas axonopodis]
MQQERDIANRLLSHFWTGRPLPVDPFEIASKVGLTVVPFMDASGWYKPSEKRIYFNPSEPFVRQRFTVAHELGHHFLAHGDRPRDTSTSFGLSADYVEVAANRFAAELLMPIGSVQMLVVDHNITNISTLAQHFDVSEMAMMYRLKNLGYLS